MHLALFKISEQTARNIRNTLALFHLIENAARNRLLDVRIKSLRKTDGARCSDNDLSVEDADFAV